MELLPPSILPLGYVKVRFPRDACGVVLEFQETEEKGVIDGAKKGTIDGKNPSFLVDQRKRLVKIEGITVYIQTLFLLL